MCKSCAVFRQTLSKSAPAVHIFCAASGAIARVPVAKCHLSDLRPQRYTTTFSTANYVYPPLFLRTLSTSSTGPITRTII